MKNIVVLPQARLNSTHGNIQFADYKNQKNLVIYLMREFSCAMCQGHVRRLKAMHQELEQSGTQILVIGGGNLEQAKNLAQQMQLPFPVIADLDREMYAAFGLDRILGFWQKSGMVIVDKQGKVQKIHATGNPAAGLLEPEVRQTLLLKPA